LRREGDTGKGSGRGRTQQRTSGGRGRTRNPSSHPTSRSRSRSKSKGKGKDHQRRDKGKPFSRPPKGSRHSLQAIESRQATGNLPLKNLVAIAVAITLHVTVTNDKMMKQGNRANNHTSKPTSIFRSKKIQCCSLSL
jgi:hypothetical protein